MDSEGTSHWLKDTAAAAARCVPISVVIVVIVVIMSAHAAVAAAAGAAVLIAAEGSSALPLCCSLGLFHEISWGKNQKNFLCSCVIKTQSMKLDKDRNFPKTFPHIQTLNIQPCLLLEHDFLKAYGQQCGTSATCQIPCILVQYHK